MTQLTIYKTTKLLTLDTQRRNYWQSTKDKATDVLQNSEATDNQQDDEATDNLQ